MRSAGGGGGMGGGPAACGLRIFYVETSVDFYREGWRRGGTTVAPKTACQTEVGQTWPLAKRVATWPTVAILVATTTALASRSGPRPVARRLLPRRRERGGTKEVGHGQPQRDRALASVATKVRERLS